MVVVVFVEFCIELVEVPKSVHRTSHQKVKEVG